MFCLNCIRRHLLIVTLGRLSIGPKFTSKTDCLKPTLFEIRYNEVNRNRLVFAL